MSDAQTAMNALTDLVTTPAFDQGKVPVPLKALGHLAAALGYEERGQRGEIVDSATIGRWRAGDAHRWADCLPARKKELCTK